jgi:hypothetical protein
MCVNLPAPNSVSKLARDEMLVARAARGSRNDNRQARCLASAGTSVCVSDDEADHDATTYAKIQAMFEATKP